ncbi:hypothetical protein IFM89_014257 [Coptis chinensis]|uniref:Pesticidal crystal cry8Ba protein n=1 Tax=Coptis chinensis TaxID=261450 RepID=A0A835IN31_9MAGN|nr:hypothetical protein IFM89_014257 [Coptis chinensis]
MFTQGLDPNALKWVREGSGGKQREGEQFNITNQRTEFSSLRNGSGRGFGLPPTSKYRSGHLPSGLIPTSRTIPVSKVESEFGSDMDTSDSEDDVYGGRYSLESSPQDHLHHRVPERSVGVQYSAGSLRHDHIEDESSDSSEYASTQVESNTSSLRYRGTYVSDSYSSSNVHSRPNVVVSNKKLDNLEIYVFAPFIFTRWSRCISEMLTRLDRLQDINVTNLQHKKPSDNEVPSAPPFSGCNNKLNQGAKQFPDTRVCTMEDSKGSSVRRVTNMSKTTASGVDSQDHSIRTATGAEAAASSISLPARVPTFHASSLGPWYGVLSYDACVRLCLHSWARGCTEAPVFLENECALLRNAFGLQKTLLQSEEELLANRSSELVSEGAAPKVKKIIGKMKVQVRKVKMGLDPPVGCSFSSLKPTMVKMESFRYRLLNLQSTMSSGCVALSRVRVAPRVPANGSFSQHSLAFMHAGTQYLKQVSELLKVGVTTLRSSSSYEVVSEPYTCLLRLKSLVEEDTVRMQPGSVKRMNANISCNGNAKLPDLGDDLIIEVQDTKGKYYGRVVAQVATIAEDPADKVRWWSIYHEPEHELVGRIQLYINYSTSQDENCQPKCGSVAETVAYDFVFEVAMKIQHFQQRNLFLHGPWKWLLTEFASYYGVSDAYTKLRYLSYVMDVATPTADCLVLVQDLLFPVVMKGHAKSTLSHQENRILGEVEDQIEQILSLVFENYKSLDEASPSGLMDVFRPATGSPAPALAPAVMLYSHHHDVLSPEAQLKLCSYFQAAAKKRSRRHLAETDEFVAANSEGALMDSVAFSTAYQKMKSLCWNIRNEVFTDIEIHNRHVLPSFIDLPNITSAVYSVELCTRLRTFLVACPPTGPSPPVADLLIATADLQSDFASWNIKPIKGGVDAKELFHLYINVWIQDKRLSLLESCKLDKVKWSGVRTQHSTTPFVDDMYDRLNETLNEYEVIICRWPEYTFVLENVSSLPSLKFDMFVWPFYSKAIADVEKAAVEALEKQYADVLSPLKENLTTKKFGLKYVQKLAKRSVCTYTVPEELGVLLNSMKRMLDVLRPRIETQLKSWGSCIPDGGNAVPGERLSEITVMLRAKFRNYLQAVVEKLAENTKVQSATKLKKILQESKETVVESDVRSRMQLLVDQLKNTIDHLHSVFETLVFIPICRGYWDRMGQEVLSFLENRKENRLWYKGSRVAVSVLDDTFASEMQQLLGNALLEKDVEPPRSMMEVRSMLCKDAANKDPNYYY